MEVALKIEKTIPGAMTDNKAAYKNIHQNLIDGCMTGDQKAQFQIYKLYYKAMYNTSLRMVNDSMEAEDIMQESFLSAFEKIGSYSGTVSFGAWLKRIVINKSLDAINKRKLITEDISVYYNISDNSNEEAELVQISEDRLEAVKRGINQLPDGYRIILTLYLIEGYDHDEIASILKISSSTSRSQLSRARQRLLESLKKNENGGNGKYR